LDPKRVWHALDFWNQQYYQISECELALPMLAAHAGVLLAVRAVEKNSAQYVGSDLHFSQGCEVTRWKAHESRVDFTLTLGRVASGWFWVQLPRTPQAVRVEGSAADFTRVAEELYKIPIQLTHEAQVVIEL